MDGALFVPSERFGAARRIAEEFAPEPLTIEDLCDQVLARVEIENAMMGYSRPLSPRRVVRHILSVVQARRRSNLPPYPGTVVHGVVWLLTRGRA